MASTPTLVESFDLSAANPYTLRDIALHRTLIGYTGATGTVYLEWSPDGTTWYPAASSTNASDTLTFEGLVSQLRVRSSAAPATATGHAVRTNYAPKEG